MWVSSSGISGAFPSTMALALLAERLDGGLVGQLIYGVDIPLDQLHVGLEELGQFPRVVGLDQQEPRPAAGQVVPASDMFRALGAGVMLHNYFAAHLLGAGAREPLE